MSDANAAIGTTKGPAEGASDYVMVTPDSGGTVKVGEFVYYEAEIEGAARQVIGRVALRSPLKAFPDTFMSDPAISPGEVARTLGFESGAAELYEVTVNTMGHYSEGLGFVNPRIAPKPGLPVYLADPEMLGRVLSPLAPGAVGAVHVGSLLTRPEGEVPVVIDGDAFTSTHLAIIAGTGAGKSYLAAVIVEELLKPNNAAAVLIIDPHDEYQTLADIANLDKYRQVDAGIDYRAKGRVFRPNQIKIRRGALADDDILYLLGDLPTPQQVIARRALRDVRRRKRDKWVLADLQQAIEAVEVALDAQSIGADERQDDYRASKNALAIRLEASLGQRNVFDDHEHTSMREMLQPGQVTVVQVGEMSRRSQQTVVATLLRRAYEGRQATQRGQNDPEDELYLPFPVFVLVEEAHRFAPAGATITTSQILSEILSEGRKFGTGVGLITQRPGKLDQDVLSQCMTQCVMRIVNPVDQQAVASSVESIGRDLLTELPALSRGQAIISGSGVNATVLCRVRRRDTAHGGVSARAAQEWTDYFSPANVKRRRSGEVLFPTDDGSLKDLTAELFGKDSADAAP
ncbi:MAG: ATP-binding protein [Chloroflexota bacterium]|jgi:hypothetical protein|nr:ATP-binding protein [Chloroflexota bacterium]MDP6756703.1 ATP-binding protein [Chloroflexota bacterium]